jgi:GR25 family glycosyltransferase involved in LPS biosynthesis
MKLHNYFDKIFIISLYDNVERWKTVKKQFENKKIKIDRFIAVDGRCGKKYSQNKMAGCIEKAKSFEIAYGVDILTNPSRFPLTELLPASSLTLSTVLLLRYMVANKMKRILICEDDIVLGKDFEKKFSQGIKEIGNKRWDLLYLGCGTRCGTEDISENRTSKNKYISSWSKFSNDEEYKVYLKHKDDLRTVCDDCIKVTEHISKPTVPGGTWCYAVSLAGAKKILKFVDNNVYNHIDSIYKGGIEDKKLIALAFDPVIVFHRYGADRPNTTIPWVL